MEIINISNPITLILVLIVILFTIFLGKTTKNSLIPGGTLLVLLGLLVYYVVCLRNPALIDLKRTIMNCLSINFIYILITFISYLWVDDIEAKLKGKKSYDNSFDWFWSKM